MKIRILVRIMAAALMVSLATVSNTSLTTAHGGSAQPDVAKHQNSPATCPGIPSSGCTQPAISTSVIAGVNYLVGLSANSSPPYIIPSGQYAGCWTGAGAFKIGETALAVLQIINAVPGGYGNGTNTGLSASGIPTTWKHAVDAGVACILRNVQCSPAEHSATLCPDSSGTSLCGSANPNCSDPAIMSISDAGTISDTLGYYPTYSTSTAIYALSQLPPSTAVNGAIYLGRSWLLANQEVDSPVGRADAGGNPFNGGWWYYGLSSPAEDYDEHSNSSFAVQGLVATGGLGTDQNLAQGFWLCMQRTSVHCGTASYTAADGGFVYSQKPLGKNYIVTETSATGSGTFSLMETQAVSPSSSQVLAGIAYLDNSYGSSGTGAVGTINNDSLGCNYNPYHSGASLTSGWIPTTVLPHYTDWAGVKAHVLAGTGLGVATPTETPTSVAADYYGYVASCLVNSQLSNGSWNPGSNSSREDAVLSTVFSLLTLEKAVATTDVSVQKTAVEHGNGCLSGCGPYVTFTITYTNGSTSVNGFSIDDPLPGGTTFVSSSCNPACAPLSPSPSSSGVLHFSIGNLAPLATGTVSYTVLIGSDVQDGTAYCNCATGFWTSAGPILPVAYANISGGVAVLHLSVPMTTPVAVGSSITVSGLNAQLDGTFTVTASTTTTITYLVPGYTGPSGVKVGDVSVNGAPGSSHYCDMVTVYPHRGGHIIPWWPYPPEIGRPFTFQASFTDSRTGTGIEGAKLKFEIGPIKGHAKTPITCTGATDASGTVSCTIKTIPTWASDFQTATITFAGNRSYPPTSAAKQVLVYLHSDTLIYTGPHSITNGTDATLSAVLKDPSTGKGIPSASVSFLMGDDVNEQVCTGVTDDTGTATCAINQVGQPKGSQALDITFNGLKADYPAAYISSTVTIK
jgi:uncharacterized repeat protein (TIGR01451 family)